MDVQSQDSPNQPTVPSTAVSNKAVSTQDTPLNYRASLIQRAAAKIPLTAEGIPVGYYRSDLLPFVDPSSPQEEVQAIRNAYSDLSFEHGYPTMPDGRPFWHKLDFEPGFSFGAFQIYLDSLDSGPRELHQLSDNIELRTLATKVYCSPQEIDAFPERDKLIPVSKMHKIIYEFSVLYYWRWRSRAHDLYKEAAYRHTRLRRQMTVEDSHYGMAERLIKKLNDEVLAMPDFWTNMSGKTAVDLLGKLVAIQRVSIGLPAAGPLAQKEQPEDMTLEMIMRTLGQRTNVGNTYDNGAQGSQGRQILDSVLADPDSARNLQEVIVRITRTHQQQLPNPYENGAQARAFKGRGRQTEIITTEDLAPFDISGAPGENLDSDSDLPGDSSSQDGSGLETGVAPKGQEDPK